VGVADVKLPEGWVAVRLYLSEEQHLAYWNADNIHGTTVESKDITDGDRLILQRTWTDMIAAAPKLAGGSDE
jgi:hypothetical protein